MTDTPNTPQDIADALLTDPDADAAHTPPPASPQTVANEPDQDPPGP